MWSKKHSDQCNLLVFPCWLYAAADTAVFISSVVLFWLLMSPFVYVSHCHVTV
jgi:hypothetical protein